jgi:hypothetical protein
MIRVDRRITIVTSLECSHGLACSTMHDYLEVSESVRMVGVQRIRGSRKNEPNVSVLATSLLHADDGEDLFNRIVTGDESWVHCNQRASKRTSMQRKHPNLTSTKKFKVTPSAGSLCLSYFGFLGESC